MKTKRYEIGGIICELTDAQVARWNDGTITAGMMARIMVCVPGNPDRYITMRRATSERIEPEISSVMNGCGAAPIH
jgi:hypothetical protein